MSDAEYECVHAPCTHTHLPQLFRVVHHTRQVGLQLALRVAQLLLLVLGRLALAAHALQLVAQVAPRVMQRLILLKQFLVLALQICCDTNQSVGSVARKRRRRI